MRPLRIGLVGTFPPRSCGLATYAADLNAALLDAGHRTVIVASVDHGDLPAPGAIPLRQHDAESYVETARLLSQCVDVVMIQHEFGIYGGPDGCLLGALTDALRVPFAVTLHTVLKDYSISQRTALTPVLRRAGQVHVFTDAAQALLVDQHFVSGADVRVVAHGVPPQIRRATRDGSPRRRLGIPTGTKVVSTFGLLSPGKGIETAITAMATLRDTLDSVCYVIAGRTHPDVARRDGETYRRSLEQLARTVGVDDSVMFIDRFLTVDELATLLAASDVFVTPYPGAEQIVSGTLSFAIAAGVPFVSTPYRYAQTMAAAGAGVIVPWTAGHEGIARALLEVLTNPQRHAGHALAARCISRQTSWPVIGRQIGAHLAHLADPAVSTALPTSAGAMTSVSVG